MHNPSYSTSITINKPYNCEVDFCFLNYKNRNRTQIGIAECKSEGQQIDDKDIRNLKRVQDDLNSIGLECYIILSKTSDEYTKEEKKLFHQLHDEKRKFIIFTNAELEPYHPYWEGDKKDEVPEPYAHDMEALYRNSVHLHLDHGLTQQNK
jgi:hypothetical protein